MNACCYAVGENMPAFEIPKGFRIIQVLKQHTINVDFDPVISTHSYVIDLGFRDVQSISITGIRSLGHVGLCTWWLAGPNAGTVQRTYQAIISGRKYLRLKKECRVSLKFRLPGCQC